MTTLTSCHMEPPLKHLLLLFAARLKRDVPHATQDTLEPDTDQGVVSAVQASSDDAPNTTLGFY